MLLIIKNHLHVLDGLYWDGEVVFDPSFYCLCIVFFLWQQAHNRNVTEILIILAKLHVATDEAESSALLLCRLQ